MSNSMGTRVPCTCTTLRAVQSFDYFITPHPYSSLPSYTKVAISKLLLKDNTTTTTYACNNAYSTAPRHKISYPRKKQKQTEPNTRNYTNNSSVTYPESDHGNDVQYRPMSYNAPPVNKVKASGLDVTAIGTHKSRQTE